MSDPTSIKTQFDGNSDKNSRHPEEQSDEGSLRFFGLRPQNDGCVTELLARSQGYRLVAGLLSHPKIMEGRTNLREDLKVYQDVLENVNAPWKNKLVLPVNKLSQSLLNISQDEWTKEYEFCFGHTAHSKVSPYELEYGEEHSHREPQELADITAFYQAFGLQVSEKSHERGDHISTECEFMHFLLYKSVYAIERSEEEHASICEEASLRFLTDHLACWMPAFAIRLRQTSQSAWMRAIADFCISFILTECEIQHIEAGDQNMPIKTIEERVETGCVSCQLSPFFKGSGSGS